MTKIDQNKIAYLRKHYKLDKLDIAHVDPNPIQQFEKWFREALTAEGSQEPNAMTLATATASGLPSARIVLLKDFGDWGFAFYTNYQSHKGKELLENPHAALVFFWPHLERQVRIEGSVEKISAEDSERYFQSRPKESQIGAHASPQSSVIPNREVLDDKVKEFTNLYKDAKVLPRPTQWGGFRILPQAIEFWQGRPSRLHDRIRFTLIGDQKWKIDRLAP